MPHPDILKTRDQLVEATKFQRRRVSSSIGPYKSVALLTEFETDPTERTQSLQRNSRQEAFVANARAWLEYYFRLRRLCHEHFHRLQHINGAFYEKFDWVELMFISSPIFQICY